MLTNNYNSAQLNWTNIELIIIIRFFFFLKFFLQFTIVGSTIWSHCCVFIIICLYYVCCKQGDREFLVSFQFCCCLPLLLSFLVSFLSQRWIGWTHTHKWTNVVWYAYLDFCHSVSIITFYCITLLYLYAGDVIAVRMCDTPVIFPICSR